MHVQAQIGNFKLCRCISWNSTPHLSKLNLPENNAIRVKDFQLTTKYCAHTGHSWGLSFSSQNQTTSCSSSAIKTVCSPPQRYNQNSIIFHNLQKKLAHIYIKKNKEYSGTHRLHHLDIQLSFYRSKISQQPVLPIKQNKQLN